MLEATYEPALCMELSTAGLKFERQGVFPVHYKGAKIGDHRIDLLVEDAVIVEIKSVERIDPVFDAQVICYLKVTGKHLGLLINFNSRLLTQGVKRFKH